MLTAQMADGTTYRIAELLSSSNAKIEKSNKADRGFLTVGLSLAPSDVSGFNVCSKATAGCRAGCLFTAGRGRFSNVARGRIAKTRAFFQDRPAFLAQLRSEIAQLRARATRKGLTLAVRLNVLSDLPWERIAPSIFSEFSDVQFYDYTKVPNRDVPVNYHLTFSRAESNESAAVATLQAGRNVAVVFESKTLPATWCGFDVINGDETDLRFLDRRGVVVGLYAKGDAKADLSGFVVRSRVIPLRVVA